MNQNEREEFEDILTKTENDDEKRENKQKLIRNEFKTVGKCGIPLIKRQDIDLNKIEPWGYTKTKQDDTENKHKTIHFFTQDWLFETVYSKSETSMEKLDQYYALFTPDFSLYANMPLAFLYRGNGVREAGKNGVRETINFNEVIGQSKNPYTGQLEDTTWGKIHYGDDGAYHIVPIWGE